MKINIITYKDQDIEIEVTKNEVRWAINREGKNYGNAVILTNKKIDNLVGVIGSIVINAIETYEEIVKNKK